MLDSGSRAFEWLASGAIVALLAVARPLPAEHLVALADLILSAITS